MPAYHSELVVIGAGPAGCGAATTAARLGLDVILIEKARFPRFRPGETLAPGAAEIVRQLVGHERYERLPKFEHAGIFTGSDRDRRFIPYDPVSGVKGVHIRREILDSCLLEAAKEAGVRVLQPAIAKRIYEMAQGKLIVETSAGEVECRSVVDACGRADHKIHPLTSSPLILSDPLELRYGYRQPAGDGAEPRFNLYAEGWSWEALISEDLVATCGMNFPFISSSPVHHGQAAMRADGTWRIAGNLATHSRIVLAGDAACRIDPASSHGVLRALVSGRSAAEAIFDSLVGSQNEHRSILEYCDFITHWFLRDCLRLHEVYEDISRLGDPVGFRQCLANTFLKIDHDS